MNPFPRAEISSSALQTNLAALRQQAPASRVMAVVKANGYGHGLLNVANCLVSADGFGLARLDEALELRAGGVTARLLLLEGFSVPPISRYSSGMISTLWCIIALSLRC